MHRVCAGNTHAHTQSHIRTHAHTQVEEHTPPDPHTRDVQVPGAHPCKHGVFIVPYISMPGLFRGFWGNVRACRGGAWGMF